jgi:hypothetical protein
MVKTSRIDNLSGLGAKGRLEAHIYGPFLPSGEHDFSGACGDCCMRVSGMVSQLCPVGKALASRVPAR